MTDKVSMIAGVFFGLMFGKKPVTTPSKGNSVLI